MRNPFDPEVMQVIWGCFPRCSITGRTKDVDMHHVLGRQSSSPFNSIPLERVTHDYGVKNQPELKEYFLRKARGQVMEKVMKKEYTITREDEDFLGSL